MNIETIMTADQKGDQLIAFAESTAKSLVRNNLTRAQIRNIFTEVRRIEASWGAHPIESMRRLNMLKPKLDYQAVRARPVELLRDVLKGAIDQVNIAEEEEERNRRFRVFMDLFEAILAYHRAEGGRS